MDIIESEKPRKETSNRELVASELVEEIVNVPKTCNSVLNVNDDAVTNNISAENIFNQEQETLENSKRQNTVEDLGTWRSSYIENPDDVDTLNFQNSQNNQTFQKDSSILDNPVLCETNYFLSNGENKAEENVAVVKVSKPLCADYRSDSGSESVDSESDSSTVSANTTTDTSSEEDCTSDDTCDSGTSGKEKKFEEKKLKKDFSLSDLPTIEDLKISVPENACVEIGTITSIVETLVVVESYKGTAALDIDTVLFLDNGKRTLGKVFDILGPVTEPVYTVRFNSQEQMKNLNIEKNLKVYYAPKTEHTNFVFMSEVLKNRGSDASWKDNTEAPPEFQDFSDDEQERLHRNKQIRETDREVSNLKEENKSKKRAYNKIKQSSGLFQTSGFRNPNFCPQRRPNIQRHPSASQSVPSLPRSPSIHPVQTSPFPYNVSPHPGANPLPIPHRVCFPSRFSGPPFPVFGSSPVFNQNQNFQHPFYQQRMHGYLQTFGSWGRPSRPMFSYQFPPPPPPPPPPAADQGEHRP